MNREHLISNGRIGDTPASPPVALYIGIPFCKTHCTFCDFNVYTHLNALQEPYVEAVRLELHTAAPLLQNRYVHSIYFGGGTPSFIPGGLIARLIDACRAEFNLLSSAEVTLEANPGTVDMTKLAALLQAGVTRLSLGVETLDDGVLKRSARAHTVAQALETYTWARRVGYDNINLDLIYGWPEQTLPQWRETLDRVVDLAPEHLSLYGLTIEEGTALARQIARDIYPMPDNDLAADMYLLADQRLAAAGYRHYEISNWARAGEGDHYLSRHNLTYWKNEPYLGFGAGAHSSFHGERYWNVKHPRAYIAAIQAASAAVAEREPIGPELEMGETMMVGLRLDGGVERGPFRARFGIDPADAYADQVRLLQDWGLLVCDDRSISLTSRGRLVSNQVLWRFLP